MSSSPDSHSAEQREPIFGPEFKSPTTAGSAATNPSSSAGSAALSDPQHQQHQSSSLPKGKHQHGQFPTPASSSRSPAVTPIIQGRPRHDSLMTPTGAAAARPAAAADNSTINSPLSPGSPPSKGRGKPQQRSRSWKVAKNAVTVAGAFGGFHHHHHHRSVAAAAAASATPHLASLHGTPQSPMLGGMLAGGQFELLQDEDDDGEAGINDDILGSAGSGDLAASFRLASSGLPARVSSPTLHRSGRSASAASLLSGQFRTEDDNLNDNLSTAGHENNVAAAARWRKIATATAVVNAFSGGASAGGTAAAAAAAAAADNVEAGSFRASFITSSASTGSSEKKKKKPSAQRRRNKSVGSAASSSSSSSSSAFGDGDRFKDFEMDGGLLPLRKQNSGAESGLGQSQRPEALDANSLLAPAHHSANNDSADDIEMTSVKSGGGRGHEEVSDEQKQQQQQETTSSKKSAADRFEGYINRAERGRADHFWLVCDHLDEGVKIQMFETADELCDHFRKEKRAYLTSLNRRHNALMKEDEEEKQGTSSGKKQGGTSSPSPSSSAKTAAAAAAAASPPGSPTTNLNNNSSGSIPSTEPFHWLDVQTNDKEAILKIMQLFPFIRRDTFRQAALKGDDSMQLFQHVAHHDYFFVAMSCPGHKLKKLKQRNAAVKKMQQRAAAAAAAAAGSGGAGAVDPASPLAPDPSSPYSDSSFETTQQDESARQAQEHAIENCCGQHIARCTKTNRTKVSLVCASSLTITLHGEVFRGLGTMLRSIHQQVARPREALRAALAELKADAVAAGLDLHTLAQQQKQMLQEQQQQQQQKGGQGSPNINSTKSSPPMTLPAGLRKIPSGGFELPPALAFESSLNTGSKAFDSVGGGGAVNSAPTFLRRESSLSGTTSAGFPRTSSSGVYVHSEAATAPESVPPPTAAAREETRRRKSACAISIQSSKKREQQHEEDEFFAPSPSAAASASPSKQNDQQISEMLQQKIALPPVLVAVPDQYQHHRQARRAHRVVDAMHDGDAIHDQHVMSMTNLAEAASEAAAAAVNIANHHTNSNTATSFASAASSPQSSAGSPLLAAAAPSPAAGAYPASSAFGAMGVHVPRMTSGWVFASLFLFVTENSIPDLTAISDAVGNIEEKIFQQQVAFDASSTKMDVSSFVEFQRQVNTVGQVRRLVSDLYSNFLEKSALLQQVLAPRLATHPHLWSKMYSRALLRQAVVQLGRALEALDGQREHLISASTNISGKISLAQNSAALLVEQRSRRLSQVAAICLPLNLLLGLMGANIPLPWQASVKVGGASAATNLTSAAAVDGSGDGGERVLFDSLIPFAVMVVIIGVWCICAFLLIYRKAMRAWCTNRNDHEDQ